MDRIWVNQTRKLQFRDPRRYLIRLRELEHKIAQSNLPERVKALRREGSKKWREAREAALFCYGMGERMGTTVYFDRSEEYDYDCVALWVADEKENVAPVQIKEVVPVKNNATTSIQEVVNALDQYPDSGDLTVAIHLNRGGHFEPAELVIPPLRIAALWVFAAISQDQSAWALWGDFIEHPEGTRFSYPTQSE